MGSHHVDFVIGEDNLVKRIEHFDESATKAKWDNCMKRASHEMLLEECARKIAKQHQKINSLLILSAWLVVVSAGLFAFEMLR